jgi:adenosyl cobinamide kinase/adenosyl cobinamide phosphate guanylyltransferase
MSTSGKTTLARELVREGLYEMYIENDDFWQYVTGLAHAWRAQENPRIEEHRALKNEACAWIVNCATRRYDTCVSGLWPHESRIFMEKLQNWQAIVMTVESREVARGRWIERGGKAGEFDTLFTERNWSEQDLLFRKLAEKLDLKGRLVSPSSPIMNLVWKGSVVLPDRRGTSLRGGQEYENRDEEETEGSDGK